MIMRMMNAIVRQITMNINFCEQNTESCRHLSMLRIEVASKNERDRELKENYISPSSTARKKKEQKHVSLTTELYMYPCILRIGRRGKIALSLFLSLSLSIVRG